MVFDYNVSGGLLTQINPGVTLESYNKAQDQVLDYYNTFQGQLAKLMTMLSDTSVPLELDGKTISVEQRGGTAEQFLTSSWLSEQEFVFSQLLDAYKFEQSLETKLNNMAFS